MKKQWKRLTQEDYIKKANAVHNNYYDYSKLVFTTVNDKITIVCPKHGNFTQLAAGHLNGNKCRKCSMELRSKNRTNSTSNFINECSVIHNSKYDYTKTIYTKSANKVTITCNIHGDFEQIANLHKRGAGCKKCAKLASASGWSYTKWEAAGTKSKEFVGFTLYVLKCFNEDEEFYKIGKTFVNIGRRYDCNTAMPYKYIVMDTIVGDARTISEFEAKIHQQLKCYRFVPTTPFNGHTESFQIADYSIIQKELNELKQNTNKKGSGA